MGRQGRGAIAMLLLVTTLGSPTAHAESAWATATPAQREVSLCAAALDDQARALARQAGDGDATARNRLREVLRAGAAWLGRAWRDGERDEEQAHTWMDEAREQLHGWSAARQTQHGATCLREGQTLWHAASGLERMLLGRVVERRQQRLLSSAQAAREAPASAAAR